MKDAPFRTGTKRPKPDAFLALCPSRHVLARLGERWTMLLVVRLKDGPVRFGELRRSIEAITQKMLTQTLRSLERDGLVSRRLVSDRPLAVEYDLTKRGKDLVPIAVLLKGWAEKNLSAIEAANNEFDALH
jgi:DNA-binding HxlR family transcriptional regulator